MRWTNDKRRESRASAITCILYIDVNIFVCIVVLKLMNNGDFTVGGRKINTIKYTDDLITLSKTEE